MEIAENVAGDQQREHHPEHLSRARHQRMSGIARIPVPPPKPDLLIPVISTASPTQTKYQVGETPSGMVGNMWWGKDTDAPAGDNKRATR